MDYVDGNFIRANGEGDVFVVDKLDGVKALGKGDCDEFVRRLDGNHRVNDVAINLDVKTIVLVFCHHLIRKGECTIAGHLSFCAFCLEFMSAAVLRQGMMERREETNVDVDGKNTIDGIFVISRDGKVSLKVPAAIVDGDQRSVPFDGIAIRFHVQGNRIEGSPVSGRDPAF